MARGVRDRMVASAIVLLAKHGYQGTSFAEVLAVSQVPRGSIYHLFPAGTDEQLGTELTNAVLRAEGVAAPTSFHLDNTAAFIHRLPGTAISTAGTPSARAVRVQIVTPPGSLNRDGQKQITREATEIVAKLAGGGTHTWVILTEAAEGGWGIDGTAFGVAEFTALARR